MSVRSPQIVRVEKQFIINNNLGDFETLRLGVIFVKPHFPLRPGRERARTNPCKRVFSG